MYRTFFDFVNARGENVIETWLNEIPVEAKDEINVQLDLLRSARLLERPAAGSLKHGDCKGLIEIRVTVKRVQYRPLAYYGPSTGQVTILIGAKEKGGGFEPREACSTAHRRIRAISTGEATIDEHNF